VHGAKRSHSMTAPQYSPSRCHGENLAKLMNAKLVRSLVHIAERVADAANISGLGADLASHLHQADNRSRNFSPALFLLHTDLLTAAVQNEVDLAVQLAEEILAQDWEVKGLTVSDFSPESLGINFFDRTSRCLRVDPSTPMAVKEPSAKAASIMRTNIARALKLLDLSAPEHAGEVNAILKQIILAENEHPKRLGFSGASSFSAWGCIFLNADEERSVFDLLQGIVHETAHLVLFAEALEGPLVLNASGETYSSPLRGDPRPMDGIYHATFVSARMYQAMKELRGNSEFDDYISNALELNWQSFVEGYDVVLKNAALTTLGETLITQAADYMEI
jgi:hypothetical protein